MKLELFAVISLIRTNSPSYFNVLLYSMVHTGTKITILHEVLKGLFY